MLKALELAGFKSFADKTRFEFPAGITVVVGPNGSGKSNIVDAIKWVLGEQSAKSLRGKDMADVIFKGAGGSNGRKPANSATATLILDNTDRRFAHDADEVLISRRVYRSGEAEYLINNETARLKDIRDMFRGTGIGTDAYSLIEQGKVDRLLQASSRERRAIFEEAAGISRFKAKKTEAQRRLARVEGNLVRLADIVEEVGSRYRSVKNQASKAARYKQYTERLQELRTFVGLKDWRSLTDNLSAIDKQKSEFDHQCRDLEARIAGHEKQADAVEQQLEELGKRMAHWQQSASHGREEAAQQKARIDLNRSRAADILERDQELQSQSQRLQSRQAEIGTRKSRIEEDMAAASETLVHARTRREQLQSDLQLADGDLARLQRENDAARTESGELITTITELGRLVSAADSQIQSLTSHRTQITQSIAELEASLTERKQSLAAFQQQTQALQRDAASGDSALAEARNNLQQARECRDDAEQRLHELNHGLTAKTQRRKVLQELEKRLEGINTGARQLLEQARKSSPGPYGEIIGVVADMLTVNVQHAGIVDVALGQAAQYIVVDGHQLLDLMATEQLKVRGRVGFIQFSDPPTLGADPDIDIDGQAGVIGRANQLVQVQPQYAEFVRKLLGGTWIIRSLADALELHQRQPGRVRLVTLDGEIVEADATVIVGPKAVVTGLVSRRSELRMLAMEIDELNRSINTAREQLSQSVESLQHREQVVQELINKNTSLSRQLSDIGVRSEEIQKQIADISSRLEQSRDEWQTNGGALSRIESKLEENRRRLTDGESRLQELNQLVVANEAESTGRRAERGQLEKSLTDSQIELAKSEQYLESLNQQQHQVNSEAAQVADELSRIREQIQADAEMRAAAENEVRAASDLLEKLETDLATVMEQLNAVQAEKTEVDQRRQQTAQSLITWRDQLRQLQEQLHRSELKSNHLKIERDNLARRLQEDYDINISAVQAEPADEFELAERDAVDREISDLRKKIGAIGSVNMDALTELEDLEQRYKRMDEQYQDLVSAKQSLENIIQRINSDSRRLFVETLDAIRGNFQSLFRQTFGGGQADLVLEEGVDPLEAGVDIVATPPGKPEFNNSLLSGGEKALTAVSLLMAIFQFRPSPYCVLDEVDAPFDEANIGRFIEVLKSFLGWTKFVIVTHSKKTMTAATTLYGVTMQESGVSKRVSVRFEDVGEEGEISAEALTRSSTETERGVA